MFNAKKTIIAAVAAAAIVAGTVVAPALAYDDFDGYRDFMNKPNIENPSDPFENYKNSDQYKKDMAGQTTEVVEETEAVEGSEVAKAYDQYCAENGIEQTNDVRTNYQNYIDSINKPNVKNPQDVRKNYEGTRQYIADQIHDDHQHYNDVQKFIAE